MSCPWDTPVRSTDGGLLCGAHGLIVCGRCGVDYSDVDGVIVDSIEEHEDDADRAGALDIERLDPIRHMEISIGRGSVLPTVFVRPPSATPQSLFPADIAHKAHPPATRFIRADDPRSFLIYTSGTCFGKGPAELWGGWAFMFGPQEPNTTSSVRERLEYEGPLGKLVHPESNRAELRAIIGALRYRNWASEGFTTLVLATTSDYIVRGATEWIRAWLQRGWSKGNGELVSNMDMWQVFLGEVERWHEYAVKIQLWKIPPKCNTETHRLAKEGAQLSGGFSFNDRLDITHG